MTVNKQAKVPMTAAKSLPDVGATEGARRATADAPTSAAPAGPAGGDAEVVPRARRRQFSKADKSRILLAYQQLQGGQFAVAAQSRRIGEARPRRTAKPDGCDVNTPARQAVQQPACEYW